MRTAIVSDLHLGSTFGEDVLRDAGVRRRLLDEVADADRVVLLGDAVELRELPLAASLERARPFFEELGETLGDRQVVFVPGNHDHRLAEPLLEALALAEPDFELEHRAPAASEASARIDAWLGRADLEIAYPGIWLRDDVYATHGHYMDCHMSLPRLECVAAAAVMRVFGRLPETAGAAEYERVLRPLYGLSFSLAQSNLAQRATRPSERAWRTVAGRGDGRGRLRRTALRATAAAAVPAGVWGVNRLLRADFDPDLSGAAITRSGIDAATEMARRLGVDGSHVITGHTHRGGPWPGEGEWPLPGGGHLHNSGSWVFASAFHHPGTPPGPYWPGTVIWVGDEGTPRPVRLLLERSREELQAVVDRLRSRSV